MIFRRKRKNGNGGVAEADRHPGEVRTPVNDVFDGTTEELFAEIERLTAENRNDRDRDREYHLLRLRHLEDG